MPAASTLLRIAPQRTVEAMASHLRSLYGQHAARGVLIGLSGGIDSAVLAALAVRSLGQGAVHVTHLYDRDSGKRAASNALLASNWLGLDLKAQDIEPALRERGVYASWIMRMTSLSPALNRLLLRCYRLAMGETPFISSLRAGSSALGSQEIRRWRRAVLKTVDQCAEAVFYARHRYRRQILEEQAAAHSWLLLGAANRSEWMVGWFVKDGVDDLPIQPLIGLYKTQVRQLAAFLGLPGTIRTQAPSPGMMKGVTDEYALGMRYDQIDVALDCLEGGLSAGPGREALSAAGVTEEQLRRVREMKRLSSWKRTRTQASPPADGGPDGGLRTYR